MDKRKREFIKLTAMTASALVAGIFLPRGAHAAIRAAQPLATGSLDDKSSARASAEDGWAFRAIDMEECQSLDHGAMARRSDMVRAAWDYLQDEIADIRDPSLRVLAEGIYHDTTPGIAAMDASDRKEVWKALKAAGYTSADQSSFLPPVPGDMKTRFPALAAPGSGYGSHHAYPGGLITHVAANVRITAAIAGAYRSVYGYEVNRDIAMTSQLLHDLHKPYVFQWLEDGSSRSEQALAGTGEHHVFSLAELVLRGAPAELVVAQACAHTHPGNDAEEAQVAGWLKAAAIIAGRDPVRYGLLEQGGATLPLPRRQEGFLCHLGDHDFVLSVPAVQWTLPMMRNIARRDYGLSEADLQGKPFNTLRNMMYSQLSAMRLHHASARGEDAVAALMHTVVRPL